MNTQPVRLERSGDVGLILVDHPPINAVTQPVRLALLEVLATFEADPSLRAAVLTCAGHTFIADADAPEPDDGSRENTLHLFLRALDSCRKPVVAAINGAAFGRGFETALACHARVAAPDAMLGLPAVRFGLIPGAGGTQRLARLIGAGRAKELILTGRHVDAAEARAIGLVERVVPPGEELDAALSLAAELAAGPLVAGAYAKRAVDAGLDGPLAAGLDLEQELFVEVFRSEDAVLGVRSFLEHGPGKATFTGR